MNTDEFKKRYQVTPDKFKGKRSNAKNFLICARRFNENNINYRVTTSGGEIWLVEYRENGVRFVRYFPFTEKVELRKLAKKYKTFKLENITTDALKVLSNAINNQHAI